MTLTKIELADNLMNEFDLTKRETKELVESFFEQIRETLESGEDVKLSGFGNFQLRNKRSRPGRNPKTGESVDVSARRVVVFKPGQKLRTRVEDSHKKK